MASCVALPGSSALCVAPLVAAAQGPAMSLKFITPLTSDVEFKNEVLDAGPSCLCVVDVHAQWCGPCTGLGKRLTNLSGDYIECVACFCDARASGAAQMCPPARAVRSYDVKWCEALAEKIAVFSDQVDTFRTLHSCGLDPHFCVHLRIHRRANPGHSLSFTKVAAKSSAWMRRTATCWRRS